MKGHVIMKKRSPCEPIRYCFQKPEVDDPKGPVAPLDLYYEFEKELVDDVENSSSEEI